MILQFRVILLLSFAIPKLALADSVQTPIPRISTAREFPFIFVMVPEVRDESGKIRSEARGTAYMVTPDGTFQQQWTVSGWFAWETYLSEDGRYLIRKGLWPEGAAPSKNDLAVAFYDNGKLIRSYSTADLIKDPKAVRVSVSHYDWELPEDSDRQIRVYIEATFALKTIEGVKYTFDVRTGNILKKESFPVSEKRIRK